MRPFRLALLSLLAPLPVLAGPLAGNTGGGGGRGPLGQVSGGIATQTASPPPASGPRDDPDYRSDSTDDYAYDCYNGQALPIRCPAYANGSIVVLENTPGRPAPQPYTGDRARVDIYAGAQKVHDSDGSLSLEVGVVDYRFRLVGAMSHYFETQPDNSRVTLTMPSLAIGLRLGDVGPTAVWVDAGVVNVRTRDDLMGDSAITGSVVSAGLEHRISPRASLVGDIKAMWLQDDVRARAGRVGIRVGHLQAAFRVLDFNVGPALFGPEVGVRF